MEIRRCKKNGHFYDAQANSVCPQCVAEMGRAGGDEMAFGLDFEEYGVTEPVGGLSGFDGGHEAGQFEEYGLTEPSNGFDSIGRTVPGMENGGFPNRGDADRNTFRAVQNYDSVTETADDTTGEPIPDANRTALRILPVTGWLVCTEGPARGMDYRIRSGYNYIGRSEYMDVCIRGDNKISRERHALVAYDHEERIFFFGPADGKSIVRVNNKMVMGPTEIHAYDTLTVGATKLMFIPLCGERFNWNE